MSINLFGQKLDWSDWLLGLAGAFIGGGAGAVSAATSMTFIDPAYVGSHGAAFMLKLAGGTFLGAGISGAALYLKQKPTPGLVTTATSVQQTETKPSGAVIETRLEQKTTEPAPLSAPSPAPAPTPEKKG